MQLLMHHMRICMWVGWNSYILISSYWNKHYFFWVGCVCVCVGGGGGVEGGGEQMRHQLCRSSIYIHIFLLVLFLPPDSNFFKKFPVNLKKKYWVFKLTGLSKPCTVNPRSFYWLLIQKFVLTQWTGTKPLLKSWHLIKNYSRILQEAYFLDIFRIVSLRQF